MIHLRFLAPTMSPAQRFLLKLPAPTSFLLFAKRLIETALKPL